MNRKALTCLVALTILAMTSAVASDDKHVVTDPASTKVVCKKQQVMGTRIPQRVCKTQAQIDIDRQNAKEATDVWQRDGNMQKTKG